MMDHLQCAIEQLINLSSALLDAAIRLKDLAKPKLDPWLQVQPSMQEIYERWLAALEYYRQQYEGQYGDNEVFQGSETAEDEIDAAKSENFQQQQMPVESYYTLRPKRFSRCSDES